MKKWIIIIPIICLLLTLAVPAQAQIIDFVDMGNTDIDYGKLFDRIEDTLDGSATGGYKLYRDVYKAFVLDPRLFIEEAGFRSAEVQQAVIDLLLGEHSSVENEDALLVILNCVHDGYLYATPSKYDYPSKSGRAFMDTLWANLQHHILYRPQAYRSDYSTLFGEVYTKTDSSDSQTLSWDLSVSLKEAPEAFIRNLANQTQEVQSIVCQRLDYNDACGYAWIILDRLDDLTAADAWNENETDAVKTIQAVLADAAPLPTPTDPDPDEVAKRNEILNSTEDTQPEETVPPTIPADTIPAETAAPSIDALDEANTQESGNIWLVAFPVGLISIIVGFLFGFFITKQRNR